MEALRPCPFCGATPFVEGNGGIFRVVCPNGDCYMHASEIYFGTEEEARAAWNTRMTPDGMDKVFRKSDAVEAFCAAYDEDIADGMDAVNAFPCGRAAAIVGGLPPVGEVAKGSAGPALTLQNEYPRGTAKWIVTDECKPGAQWYWKTCSKCGRKRAFLHYIDEQTLQQEYPLCECGAKIVGVEERFEFE